MLSPNDNTRVLNFLNFNDFGNSTLKDSTAFKKIQYFSKTNPQALANTTSDFDSKYRKIANLYLNDTLPNNTSSYGTMRQHNYSSLMSTTNTYNTLLDGTSLNKFLEYNDNASTSPVPKAINLNGNGSSRENILYSSSNSARLQRVTEGASDASNYPLSKLLNYTTVTSVLNSDSDGPHSADPLKYFLNNRHTKKRFLTNPLESHNNPTFGSAVTNESLSYRSKDLKSPNQQLLTSDRNTRLINTLVPNKTMFNFSDRSTNLNSLIHQKIAGSLANSHAKLFASSTLKWGEDHTVHRLLGNVNMFPNSHTPLLNKNSLTYPQGYDRFPAGEEDVTPTLLRSKEESAPNHIFSSY